MRVSRRGVVDPCIVMAVMAVMDVMDAARQAEARGRRILHMAAAAGWGGSGATLPGQLAFVLAMVSFLSFPARAQDATLPAQLVPQDSSVRDAGVGIDFNIALSRPVPFRTMILSDPPRLVVDFRDLSFAPVPPETVDRSDRVKVLRWGRFRPGWSRMVAELDGPFAVATAALDSGTATLRIRLLPVSDAMFQTLAAPASDADWDLPRPATVAMSRRRQTGDRPLVVMLDPGHGGIDPGAEAAGIGEADLMLAFANELGGVLRRAGMQAALTRTSDDFVPLEARISRARAAGADILLSLHADALSEGRAVGATIYLLADDATEAAAALLAERHDRDDLMAGVDLSGQDDLVADVLMDMARTETQPRADRLAATLVRRLDAADLQLHSTPVQAGAFTVLKAPDIPSLLLELGFISSADDRARLIDPKWRGAMQAAILAALQEWAAADAAEARLLRQ